MTPGTRSSPLKRGRWRRTHCLWPHGDGAGMLLMGGRELGARGQRGWCHAGVDGEESEL